MKKKKRWEAIDIVFLCMGVTHIVIGFDDRLTYSFVGLALVAMAFI